MRATKNFLGTSGTVAIKADAVSRCRHQQPSGNRVRDEAARRIVQLAPPIRLFPRISKEVDVINIRQGLSRARIGSFR